jgi:hypothetical protein
MSFLQKFHYKLVSNLGATKLERAMERDEMAVER